MVPFLMQCSVVVDEMSAAVMAAAAAPVRVGGVQVQEVHLDGALLGVHLIQMIHHSIYSFGTFHYQALHLLIVSYC